MLKQKNNVLKNGFTIVEMLIVIVVIGVLAALVLNGFSQAQDKARVAKVTNDIALFKKAAMAARESSGKSLLQVTGNNCTRCACPYNGGDMTVYSTLPKTHGCWTAYYNTLNAIASAANTNLDQLKLGDPWGSPYSLDENEGESGGCGKDLISSFGKSGNANGGTVFGNTTLPSFTSACI